MTSQKIHLQCGVSGFMGAIGSSSDGRRPARAPAAVQSRVHNPCSRNHPQKTFVVGSLRVVFPALPTPASHEEDVRSQASQLLGSVCHPVHDRQGTVKQDGFYSSNEVARSARLCLDVSVRTGLSLLRMHGVV